MNKGTLLAQSFVSEVKLKKVLTQEKKVRYNQINRYIMECKNRK